MNLSKLKLQHYINHIAFILDSSGSMGRLLRQCETIFDQQIDHLKRRSKELDQETRVSIYLFDSRIECIVYDMDVMRIPSMKNTMWNGGSTALLDATALAIEDMRLLPEKYGDHAFLVNVLTDGEENASQKYHTSSFKNLVNNFKENWTIACLVPNARGIHEAKSFGFPANNVQVWSTDEKGIQEVGRVTAAAMDSYMVNRAKGVRSTSSFYSTDLSGVSKAQVAKNLTEVNAGDYEILRVSKKDGAVIKPFVESWLQKPYRIGQAYYELVKTEEIQGGKVICVQNKQDGRVFTGQHARDLLGLPTYNIKVKPGDHGNWNIFVQSTSVNRKLPNGTSLLVMK